MDERSRLLELIRANAVNYSHFFDGLEDASWLDFLVAEGFFTNPPPPERSEDWVRFPLWPESAYLVRIAAAAPERVGEVAAAIPPTDNERVMADLAEIAAALPAATAIGIAGRIGGWLREHPTLLTLPDAGARLAVHLAELGEMDAALELARGLLRLEGEERPGVFEPRVEPVGRIGRWEYGQVLGEVWPSFLASGRDPAITFLADLLARAVDLEAGEDGGDFTHIVRPSIADHAQNNDEGLLDLLIAAMRDAAVEAATESEGRAAVLAALAARPQAVFARIALHVITVVGEAAEAFAALTGEEAAHSPELWHEYGELLARRFIDLDEDSRQAVLALLAGEEVEPLEEEGEEERDARRRRRLLERLALIAPELEGRWADTYDELLSEFGEPEHPGFRSYISGFTGPTSPLGAEELRELGAEGTVRALAAWEPPGAFDSPTPEGLARVLEEAVKADPGPYAEVATQFEALDPTYVRGLIGGLSAAVRDERSFPWRGPLALCAWVLEQPYEPEEERADIDRDPSLGWSRKAIADLLAGALGEEEGAVPIAERESVFALLAVLTEDPNPTPEHEERYGGSNMDPATLALNTTRGEAMNALVRYALWVSRHEPEPLAGLAGSPEARALLERHLDPGIDPSLAVRSVYGRWFASLFNLDREWLDAHMGMIFPAAPQDGALFAAAFDAFLAFTQPWPGGFDLLGVPYGIAAGRAGEEPRSRTFHGDPRARLGDHLITLRAYGTIDLEPGGVLDVFWSNAPAEIRGAVVRNAGWTIERTENPDPQVFARLVETWEWIAVREDGEEAKEVLKGFGAWLAAPNLDPTWLLQQAQGVLGRRIPLDPDFAAYAALPRLAKSDARSALATLRGMLENERQPWAPYGSRDEIRELLEFALTGPDPTAREDARHLVDLLIALGLSELRDLAELGGPEAGAV